jgi:hypothetical protein
MLTGDSADEIVLAQARCAAEAQIELNRARRARIALIERMESLGSLEVPRFFPTNRGLVRWLIKMDKWGRTRRGVVLTSRNRRTSWARCPHRNSTSRWRRCVARCRN